MDEKDEAAESPGGSEPQEDQTVNGETDKGGTGGEKAGKKGGVLKSILEILRDTKPDLPDYWRASG